MFCIPVGALECEIRTRTIPQWMLKWCPHPGEAPHPPTKRIMINAKLAICCQTCYRWVDSWGVWLCMKHADSVVFPIRQLARKHYGHYYFTHRHRLVENMLLTSGFKIEKCLHIKTPLFCNTFWALDAVFGHALLRNGCCNFVPFQKMHAPTLCFRKCANDNGKNIKFQWLERLFCLASSKWQGNNTHPIFCRIGGSHVAASRIWN